MVKLNNKSNCKEWINLGFEQIVDGIYHVGDFSSRNGLDCNPYLLIDGDEAVLFDPGSMIEFDEVIANLKEIIDLEKINYIVIHHQDADICSSVPLYENMGLDFKVVTSWRTMTLVQYYGIKSDYYLLEENNFNLQLHSGRQLEFIQTPYLHFPGAFNTYDVKTRTLFSSDLFGAFSFNRTLYADETYMDKMLTFHEHYMPSNSVLRPVMDVLLTYDINMIMPQHGSIINTNVESYIRALRTLECGTLLAPVKKNLKESGGFTAIFNDVLNRLLSLYKKEDVMDVFSGLDQLTLNEDVIITEYNGNPETVWNILFEEIKVKKGMVWITVVEPHVRNLCSTYDIELPEVMHSLLQSVELENKRLMEMNKSLEQTIHTVNEKLIKCSITGLYNETFFRTLVLEELENEDWRELGAYVSIGIDNFSKYKLSFGTEEEHNVLNNMAYLFKEKFGENAVFRLDSTDFGLYVKGLGKNDLIEKLEALRIEVSRSEIFLSQLTISIGVVFASELEYDAATYEQTVQHYMELSLTRLRIAKLKGKNYLCHSGDEVEDAGSINSILIVDHDETNLEVIRNFIQELGVEVYIAHDGYEAFDLAEQYSPKLIITEISIPKLDGFLLREALLGNSKTKDIDVVFLSHLKDDTSVKRAISLGVLHYLKKPYMLSELIGIVKRNVKGLA